MQEPGHGKLGGARRAGSQITLSVALVSSQKFFMPDFDAVPGFLYNMRK